MAATNQLQQSSSQFYLDQYVQKLITFTSTNSADAFETTCQFHRLGSLVMLSMPGSGANAGVSTSVAQYAVPAGTVPLEFRPSQVQINLVYILVSGPSRSIASLQINTDGSMSLNPVLASTFTVAKAAIGGSTVAYFK